MTAAPGHVLTMQRGASPLDPWTAVCECGWSEQWVFRTPLIRWHAKHAERAAGAS